MPHQPALMVLSACILAAALPAAPASAGPASRGTAAETPGARLAVRSGDPAPVTPRVPSQLIRPGFTTDGGVIFADIFRTAIYKRAAGVTSVLAYVGEECPAGIIFQIGDPVAAPDGSVLAVASSAAGMALLRLPAAGGEPEVLLGGGRGVAVPGGEVTLGLIFAPAVDAAGNVVVTTWLDTYPGSALVRVPVSGVPAVLVRDGDPLGGSTIRRILSTAGVSGSGLIAFAAELASNVQVVATLTAGGPPVVVQSFPISPQDPGGPFAYAAPSINDAGDVAFLEFAPTEPPVVGGTSPRLHRVRGGVASTIAAPGSPAPGGESFSSIVGMPPIIDAQGRVLFAANTTANQYGFYRFDAAAETIVALGNDAGAGTSITYVDAGAAPAQAPDGSILFASWDSAGYALYSGSGSMLHTVVRTGDPVAGAARFVGFQFPAGFGGFGPVGPPPVVTGPFPYLGSGPCLSPRGRMIFDATVTGHASGLFVREPDGSLTAVAMEGDPAPGGGTYAAFALASHHSINDAGTVAFLSGGFLAYGPMAGPLTRLVAVNDPVPGSDAAVQGFPPPSRLNAAGALAIPLYLSDGTVALYGWDGSQLIRVAGAGDVIPNEGAILSVLTGVVPKLNAPVLDDAGDVVFEAITAVGGHALYRAPLRAGGAAEAVRLIGENDPVEDGTLSTLIPGAYDHDATGRLAFQTPRPGSTGSQLDAATYVRAPGAAPRRLVVPGDDLPGVGVVQAVVPHLALAGSGRIVHEVAGPRLLVSTPRPADGATPAGFATAVLAAPGMASPDGGTYYARTYLFPDPPPRPGPGTSTEAALAVAATISDRLASNGGDLIAWQAYTTAGPESIVLFDLTQNHAPFADAGPDQVVECAGPAGRAVTLDAGASFDPDGDPLSYEWAGPFGTATGPRPVVTLPLGRSTITLTARDTHGAASPASLDITVRDTQPPTASATATPAVIWPPNGRMTPILVTLTSHDLCDPAPVVVLTGISSDDRRGFLPPLDVSDAAVGTDDRAFAVRARRSGGQPRSYVISYRVTDGSGNSAIARATVTVPSRLKP